MSLHRRFSCRNRSMANPSLKYTQTRSIFLKNFQRLLCAGDLILPKDKKSTHKSWGRSMSNCRLNMRFNVSYMKNPLYINLCIGDVTFFLFLYNLVSQNMVTLQWILRRKNQRLFVVNKWVFFLFIHKKKEEKIQIHIMKKEQCLTERWNSTHSPPLPVVLQQNGQHFLCFSFFFVLINVSMSLIHPIVLQSYSFNAQ